MTFDLRAHAKAVWEGATKRRPFGPFARLDSYLATLSPGDRIVAYVLCAFIIAFGIAGLYALEQALLVRVPAYGGTLLEGEVGSPRFVNPLLAISDADRDLTALTYAGLMGLSGDGSLTPVLASSYSISEDGKTYIFTLRPDAKFSDGTPVTADDVVFTVQKAEDPAIKSPQFAAWSGVVATALDEHTVEFSLPKPYAPFLQNTTLGILPARLWRNIPDEQFPFSNLVSEPVAAGAFKFGSITRDGSGLITSYTVVANSDYPLGRPYLNAIKFTFFAQSEDLANALKQGAVQSAYGVPNAGALTAPYSRVFGVFFNPTNDPVLARPEIRQALSVAIDRDQIVQNVLGGYATAIDGPLPPGSGIVETPVPHSDYPAADAEAILGEFGWKAASTTAPLTSASSTATTTLSTATSTGGWINKTAKLSFSSITIKTSNVPELKAVAAAIQSDWQKLGISVSVELYEPGDLNQSVIRPRKYDALLFGMVIGRDQDLYAFWDSQERNDPGLNIALYANKDVDALLAAAREEENASARRSDLQKIEDDIAADYPAAFTHAPDFMYAVPKQLQGIVLPQITVPADRFASVTKWYLFTEPVWPFLASNKT